VKVVEGEVVRIEPSLVVAYVHDGGADHGRQLAARLQRVSGITAHVVAHSADVPDDAGLVVATSSEPGEVRTLRERLPRARLVVARHGPSVACASALLLSGADAVVDLDEDDAALAHGLHAALTDGSFVPHAIQAAVLSTVMQHGRRASSRQARIARLTPKERETLQWLAAGEDRAAIAEQLHEPLHRVRARIDRAKAKLGVTSQRQAVAMLAEDVTGSG
jgi:DNA-binding NarL/FixJ family response regulator